MIQASVPGIELKQFVNSKHGFYAGLTWMFGDGDHYEHTEFVIESIQFVRETVENYKKLRADIAAANADWKNRMDDYRDYDKIIRQPGFIAMFGEIESDQVHEVWPCDSQGYPSMPVGMCIELHEYGKVFEVFVDGSSLW